MKKVSFLVIFTVISATLYSQSEAEKKTELGWQKEIVGNLSFTQNNFDNWTQGGEDSWAWQLDINKKFINEKERYQWSNTGKISFGQAKIGDADSRKAADEIKFESVFKYKLKIYIDPYIAVTGLTQMAKGYNYTETEKIEVSAFLDPGYFTQSFGIGYEPNESIKTRFGAAVKETITKNHPSPYADDPDTDEIEKTKVEFGTESVTDLSLKLSENILFTSKLELFSNMERFDEIDVNWDNVFTSKISKFLNVSLNVRIFYDKDISKKRQIKQILAVGFSYVLL